MEKKRKLLLRNGWVNSKKRSTSFAKKSQKFTIKKDKTKQLDGRKRNRVSPMKEMLSMGCPGESVMGQKNMRKTKWVSHLNKK